MNVGSKLVDEFVITQGGLSTPVLGAQLGVDLSVPVAVDPDGASFAGDVQIEEVGSGMYRISYQTTASSPPGRYSAMVLYTGTQTLRYEFAWDVVAGSYVGTTSPATTVSGVNRLEMRRASYDLIGDLRVLTATNTTGSSTFEDVVNLSGSAGDYAGRELYMVSSGNAANNGKTMQVLGSNGNGLLQLTPGFPDQVMAGDEAEMVNTFGIGMGIQDVHRIINQVLAAADVKIPVIYDAPGYFDYASRGIAIPDTWVGVDGVSYVRQGYETRGYEPMRRASGFGKNGWFVEPANRTIYIGQYTGYNMHDTSLRLHGWEKVSFLNNDTDRIPVDLEWLSYEVAGRWMMRAIAKSESLRPVFERTGAYYMKMADDLRTLVRTRPRAGYTVLK